MTTQRFRLDALTPMLLAAASVAACSTNGSTDPDDVAPPLAGTWTATCASDNVSLRVNVDEHAGRVADILGGAGNPQVFTIESALLRKIERTSADRFSAEAAIVTYQPSSPVLLAPLWPVTVTYTSTELTFNPSDTSWTASAACLKLSRHSSQQDTSYEPFGACEERFTNSQNQILYTCDYPVREQGCSSFAATDESHFWKNTTCPRLGYEYQDTERFGDWWNSATSNATPGEYGFWGDRSGTTPLPIPNPAEPTGSGGEGATCLEGTWAEDPADCAGMPITLSFQGGTGRFTNPDCNGICTPIVFPYSYTVSGDTVTLNYATPPPVTCDGESYPIDQPANDTFSFTCEGNTLTTTTSLGTTTYRRR
jgi:hypothetical protein